MGRIFPFLVLCLSLTSIQPAALQAGRFAPELVIRGVETLPESCRATENAVWVRVGGQGECIRYFAAGLNAENPVALVHFHGDRLWQFWDDESGHPQFRVVSYQDNAEELLRSRAAARAEQLGLPVILVARPGTYGSSGDHKQRRRPREIEVIDVALQAIKKRYRIARFALSGQSGGGHVVASLLTRRDDVSCAVMTSGVVAVGLRAHIKGWQSDITGFTDYFDPIDHVSDIKPDQGRRIFLVADPQDREVPFETQVAYHAALKAVGHGAHLIRAKARDPGHHNLEFMGPALAAACARKVPMQRLLDQAGQWALDAG